MNRSEFKLRMLSLKSYRELNPGKGYWDWKVEAFEGGGEVLPDNSPVHANPITNKPLANGAILPVFDLEDAANFTPVGDALSVRDAYIAASNNDWLGLALAGLGVVPFIPTVNRKAIIEQMDKRLLQLDLNKKIMDLFLTQRNNTYESLIENEDAFRRAANADRKGSNYSSTYQDLLRSYSKDQSIHNPNLSLPAYDPELFYGDTKALVHTYNPLYIYLNTRYKDPDELESTFKNLNPGLIRHEMGHLVDIQAGLDYTNTLSKPSKFESEERLKEMFPRSYRRLLDEVLNRGSEIKSYMNKFRDYLMNKGLYNPNETTKSFRLKLDEYGEGFPVLKKIFDSYKSKKQFIKDYNSVPIVQNNQRSNKSNYA